MLEWDQAKSDKNLAKRGFDFEYAARIFEGDVLHASRRGAANNLCTTWNQEGAKCLSSGVHTPKSVSLEGAQISSGYGRRLIRISQSGLPRILTPHRGFMPKSNLKPSLRRQYQMSAASGNDWALRRGSFQGASDCHNGQSSSGSRVVPFQTGLPGFFSQ